MTVLSQNVLAYAWTSISEEALEELYGFEGRRRDSSVNNPPSGISP
jgi:hypothetical protein